MLNLDQLGKADLENGCSWRVYKGDRAITFSVETGGITIATHSCDKKGGCVAEVARDFAPFDRITRGRFGGEQLLVRCPRCDRRCRILHSLSGRVGCRLCLGLLYASENMSVRDRIWWKVTKIRRRANRNADPIPVDEFPARPLRMKRRKYQELVARHKVLCRQFS